MYELLAIRYSLLAIGYSLLPYPMSSLMVAIEWQVVGAVASSQ
jgi:hypothetical protein